MSKRKFLGRDQFDERTMMYHFRDDSGMIPLECQLDVQAIYDHCADLGIPNGAAILGTIQGYKQRLLGKNNG